MAFRLLPDDRRSRLAVVWLVYLGTPVWYMFAAHLSTSGSVATLAAIALFLPLYFRGYWLHGPRELWVVAGITAIAVGLLPVNPGAAVFFIYAASFAFRCGRPPMAASVIGAIVAIILIDAWLISLQPGAWVWALLLSILIGGVNIYFAEMERADRRLRSTQDELRHMAIVAERERIGRDLHDLLGHTLSVIVLKSELASKLAVREPARALAEIQDVERISREALAEVRAAVQGFHGHGFADELKAARTALDAAGVALECDVAPVALSSQEERALALAVREAVTNVIRHARAHRCTIRLEMVNGVARLEIQDDGVGGQAKEGSGLSGMRARLAEIGGRLEHENRGGTRLLITVPLAPAGCGGGAPS